MSRQFRCRGPRQAGSTAQATAACIPMHLLPTNPCIMPAPGSDSLTPGHIRPLVCEERGTGPSTDPMGYQLPDAPPPPKLPPPPEKPLPPEEPPPPEKLPPE